MKLRLSSLINNTRYKVRYKNLVEEEDQTQPLVEVVRADEVRPVPPSVIVNRASRIFNHLERVDAFDNDGWWVGTFSGKQGLKYWVYFETTGDELAYGASRLRNHIEWYDDHWVSFKQRF
ncbi:putative Plant Tudor-like protein [Hibiscus syriacus]|uniref:Plant Tudor-like protein n=1 Tax=Hibiscus syriacus TaxID=106335 RepID=A0A6A2WDZ7_HIBSY|nr:putative Plant Tudor-like protein [Hibiscus syriacus]